MITDELFLVLVLVVHRGGRVSVMSETATAYNLKQNMFLVWFKMIIN